MANVFEYKIGNNVNIANFVCLWKTRLRPDLAPWTSLEYE